MSLSKKTFIDNVSTIMAEDMNSIQDAIIDNEAAIATKVTAVDGKGLSTNDYTTAEKTKLAGIASGATNVSVDDTLSVVGDAADAKKVGDLLKTAISLNYETETTFVASNTDLNDLTEPGNYKWSSSAIASTLGHCPIDRAGYMFVIIAQVSCYFQIVMKAYYSGGDLPKMYVRCYGSGAWSDWQQLTFVSQLPTVPAVDPTLSVEGNSADAKATGDAIASTNTELSYVDNKIDTAGNLVNYGYDEDQVRDVGKDDSGNTASGGIIKYKIGAVRHKTQFVFNCAGASSSLKVKLSNNIKRGAINSDMQAWTDDGVQLASGHAYLAIMRKLSGVVTPSSADNYPVISVYGLGETSSMGSVVYRDASLCIRAFTAPETAVNIGLYLYSNTVLEDATYEILLKDITCDAAQKSIITSNIESNYAASKNYAVGKLLIVGQTLYKVITAISSGDTITPGTNVTETTIDTELASLASS